MAPNDDLRESILEVLDDVPGTLKFKIAGFKVSPELLEEVRMSVDAQNIFVEVNSGIRGLCAYKYKDDKLIASFRRANNLAKQAAIIHEAVHALQDKKRDQTKVKESEAAAYVAQCYYAQIHAKSPNAFLDSPDKHTKKVFFAAWEVAHQIRYRQTPDFDDLLEAIAEHPLYKARAEKKTSYDGVTLKI